MTIALLPLLIQAVSEDGLPRPDSFVMRPSHVTSTDVTYIAQQGTDIRGRRHFTFSIKRRARASYELRLSVEGRAFPPLIVTNAKIADLDLQSLHTSLDIVKGSPWFSVSFRAGRARPGCFANYDGTDEVEFLFAGDRPATVWRTTYDRCDPDTREVGL
jgi:hypothetical protein